MRHVCYNTVLLKACPREKYGWESSIQDQNPPWTKSTKQNPLLKAPRTKCSQTKSLLARKVWKHAKIFLPVV